MLGLVVRNNKWEERGKQVNQLVNILCQAAKTQFIDNTNVTNRMLNNSKLYPNPVGTKVGVNNIWKLTSQWLTQLCEVEK